MYTTTTLRAALLTAVCATVALAQWGDVEEANGTVTKEIIEGGHSVTLSGPISDDVARMVKRKAYGLFKDEVLGWLEMNLLVEWKAENGIDQIHLDRFARGCANRAKQNTRFDGPTWIFTYQFPATDLAKAAEHWNTRHDALAVQSYVKFTNAYQAGNLREAYVFGIRTVYHSRAHIGARKSVAGKTGKDFIYEAHQMLRELLGKLNVNTNDAILAGKPGFKPEKELVVTADIGGTPLPNMKLAVVLHGGPQLANVQTDKDGKASLGGIITPYVPNGSFFNIVPNPGAELDESMFFRLKDLGIKLSKSYDQTMMFKISRPTFRLEYDAKATGDMVVPRDVAKPTFLVKYLQDSCYMDTAAWGTSPDIELDVECTVSSYEHMQIEKHILKSEYTISVTEKNSPRHSAVQYTDVYEKSFRINTDVPTGLFFWETAKELGHAVKDALLSL